MIKMLTIARGADFNADPGDLLPDDHPHAEALVAGGHAVAIDADQVAATPAARRRTATAAPRATRGKR